MAAVPTCQSFVTRKAPGFGRAFSCVRRPLSNITWASAGFVTAKYPHSMRYFFDTRDNGTFIEDDVGVELADLEAVKTQAALSLAELARDVLPGSIQTDALGRSA